MSGQNNELGRRMFTTKWRDRRISASMLAIAAALVVAGCGSSSSETSSTNKNASNASSTQTSNSESSQASTEATESGESGAASMSKVYASGVPTLAELYKVPAERPPTSGPAVKKGMSIAFISCGQEAPGCADVPDAMKEPAAKMGWAFRIFDGKFNVNDGYSRAFREALATKPNAIVVNGINCDEIEQPIKEAVAAKIPVMGLESFDCSDKYAGKGPKLYSIPVIYNKGASGTAGWFEEWGARMADYVVDASKGEAKAIVVKYNAPLGDHVAAAQEAVLTKCSGCKVVAEVPFQASENVPNGPEVQKFNTVLAQQAEANAVLPPFDSSLVTAGIAKAIVDAHRESMVVVGAEGSAPADTAIMEGGGITAEPAAFDNSWMGWAALDELNRYFNHQAPANEGIGYTTVDKSHNMPPKGQNYTTSVPYKEIYEKSWGVK